MTVEYYYAKAQFRTMIKDDKKEEVRDAADIIDVVSDYVKLRRTGSNFTGLCPFHSEKTPSFSVSPKIGIFKCFGCGEGGDVFNFVMKIDGVGFEEAVRTLADRYNVIIPEREEEGYDPRQHLKDGIFHALRFAGNYFHQELAESDDAKHARTYLKEREYPWKTVRKYGIGYAPDRFDGLLNAAEKAGINLEYLQEAGLVKARERGSGFYDTFRSRLMFPIFNPSGKVIAFGGRTLSSDKTIPKYINSPQTPVYNKSEVLYGIHTAKNEIRKAGEVILVEGYTDVISMHQVGIGNVVSTSGTSLTSSQMRILKRYGDTMLIIFDADSAGVKAAVRGITIALEEGMAVRVLTLPAGEDPDSYVRQFGEEGFDELKRKETRDFLRFLVGLVHKEGRWSDPVDRKKAISEMLEAIAVIPDELSRVNFIQELSGICKIGDRTLLKELDVVRARREKKVSKAARPGREYQGGFRQVEQVPAGGRQGSGNSGQNMSSSGSGTGKQPEGLPERPLRRPEYEKELIRLMLAFGEKLVVFIGGYCNEKHFEDPDLRTFYEDIMHRYQSGDPVSVEVYSQRDHPFPQLMGEIMLERHAVSELGMRKRGVSLSKDSNPLKNARGALKSLKLRFLDRTREELLDQFREASPVEKIQLQEWLKSVTLERNRTIREPMESLFPDLEEPK